MPVFRVPTLPDVVEDMGRPLDYGWDEGEDDLEHEAIESPTAGHVEGFDDTSDVDITEEVCHLHAVYLFCVLNTRRRSKWHRALPSESNGSLLC